MKDTNEIRVPFWKKFLLTVNEASEVFNIGEKKLRNMISNDKNANWLRYNGERIMIHRKYFEQFLDATPTF